MPEQLTTEQGIELFNQGKYPEAVKLFKQIIAKNPYDVIAGILLADAYSQMGKNAKAIDEYLTLIQIDPTNPQYYFNLGIVYEKIPNLIKAEESYAKVLELNPDYVEAKERLDIINKTQSSSVPGGVPDEVKSKLNWGAFLMTWIWGIRNKVSIALLLGLIPVLDIFILWDYDYINTDLIIVVLFVHLVALLLVALIPVLSIILFLWYAAWGIPLVVIPHEVIPFLDIPIGVWNPYLALTSILGLAIQIYLLIKGNELAWKSMKYDSVEHFFRVQRIWLIVGLVIIPITILLFSWLVAISLAISN